MQQGDLATNFVNNLGIAKELRVEEDEKLPIYLHNYKQISSCIRL